MFSPVYFPLVAALAANEPSIISRVSDGRLVDALSAAARVLDSPSGKSNADIVRLAADLRLVADQTEDAEDGYRRTLRIMRASHELRAMSCRDTGWQAMFRHRSGTALSCWVRVLGEPNLEPDRRREARFAIVAVLGELGRLTEMDRAMDAFEEDVVDGHPMWTELASLMRFDMAVQNEIRQSEALQDHVYWQSIRRDTAGPEAKAPKAPPTSALLRLRYQALYDLRMLANGARDAFASLDAHLRWANQENQVEYQRALRVDIAVASLSSSSFGIAEQVLQPLTDHARDTGGRLQLEHLYCTAKVRREQGRTADWHQKYSRYALLSLRASRDDARVPTPYSVREAARPDAPLDDVGARLPAKYRRAYRYLLANLDRRDLSVREVAAEINVTERALQTAFKNFVGLTPTEVIRRRRMESIHAELSHEGNDKTVLDVANSWGVMHRSTLVNGYRKYFDEVPSETLSR
ncbi:hypothetical protein WM40_18810 [Robbsia andropogonis]|uniref:HTH araC/xylS-type domain-containing protein n=1 Tax=Robbsia andropogonis TaxID=28092 RepID=A0A0F5JY29_9BURK|nr:helix-turn-helix transcriptional regulator [Robbsia andropogonis]KKB62192.1 hypothetical protein WM40_18810 [Robbsia andropogonis]MCP1119474.1 helix-turn-helix transcriptional regulator [Robbsia andropogonis]MCP1129457.1 helix-turn-helix transcriptional regulator [Robbsia andropogonis]